MQLENATPLSEDEEEFYEAHEDIVASPKARADSGSGAPVEVNADVGDVLVRVKDLDTGKEYALEKVYRIKDLDTGKEFLVDEGGDAGSRTFGRVKDLETGQELTLDEFGSTYGLSPIMREVARREGAMDQAESPAGTAAGVASEEPATDTTEAKPAKKPKNPKRWIGKRLKEAKSLASGTLSNLKGGREKKESPTKQGGKEAGGPAAGAQAAERQGGDSTDDDTPARDSSGQLASSSGQDLRGKCSYPVGSQVKVSVNRKLYKEFTDLRLVQELGGHEGAVWTMKFSDKGEYLASAGQDAIVRVWKVESDAPVHEGSFLGYTDRFAKGNQYWVEL